MECPLKSGKAFELMMSYTAGTLEPEKQIELERHLPICEECRKAAAAQKAMWEALDVWRPAAISDDFGARLYQRIAEEEASPAWRMLFRMPWGSLFRPAVPVAAACGALMIAFIVKDPLIRHHSSSTVQQKISIEQVERALDDMDMLKQLSAPAPAEGQASERI